MTDKKWNEPKKKPTNKTLKHFEKEESDTVKVYRNYGFNKQANDEKRHAKFFKEKLKQRQKR